MTAESHLLKRDEAESERLTNQAKRTTLGVGGLVVPKLEPLLNSPLQAVLDLGCGNAAWLVYMADKYPTCKHFAGLDISGNMFPTDRTGLDLRVGSAIDPFPEEWNGTFDLVSARYLFMWIDTSTRSCLRGVAGNRHQAEPHTTLAGYSEPRRGGRRGPP
jgi:SAM-dependent methyltransferase